MIAARRENEKWKQLIRNQFVSARSKLPPHSLRIVLYLTTVPFIQMEENMMRHRAILTGTFQKATHYNKPLPRMKVQPLHVSGMITKRIRARERRLAQSWNLASLAKHMEEEAEFERALQRNTARFGQEFEGVFQHADWGECISPTCFSSMGCYNRNHNRIEAKLPASCRPKSPSPNQ